MDAHGKVAMLNHSRKRISPRIVDLIVQTQTQLSVRL